MDRSLVRHHDNVLLVTATSSSPREGIDFFPLTVDVEERLYARGKIPGSFHKREGRPSTPSILIARLTDRPIRPLFPKDFKNEVQLIITPLSIDTVNPYDITAVTSASAALTVSDIPFEGPIAATRIGYLDGEFVVNPTYEEINRSTLDLVVAGSRSGVIMMEAGASEVSEDVVQQAIEYAQEMNLYGIELQEELAEAHGKPPMVYVPRGYNAELTEKVIEEVAGSFNEALGLPSDESDEKVSEIETGINEKYSEDYQPQEIEAALDEAMEAAFKQRVLENSERPDGPFARRDSSHIQRGESASSYSWHGPVYERRDAGAWHLYARLGWRCPEARQSHAGRDKTIHAPLQLPAVFYRRGAAHTLYRAARDRTRSIGREGAVLSHTERGGVPLHDSSGGRVS